MLMGVCILDAVLVAGVAYSAWLFRQREPDEEGEEELA